VVFGREEFHQLFLECDWNVEDLKRVRLAPVDDNKTERGVPERRSKNNPITLNQLTCMKRWIFVIHFKEEA
jgi:hypothetical protein